MNIVDSSGWLEYFAGATNAAFFAAAVERTADLLVPTLSIYEVFKRVLTQRNENDALQAVALMQQAAVVDLDAPLAMDAAKLSIAERITDGGQYHSGNRPAPRRYSLDAGLGLRARRGRALHRESLTSIRNNIRTDPAPASGVFHFPDPPPSHPFLLTGVTIDAPTAAWGLVNKVVPAAQLEEATRLLRPTRRCTRSRSDRPTGRPTRAHLRPPGDHSEHGEDAELVLEGAAAGAGRTEKGDALGECVRLEREDLCGLLRRETSAILRCSDRSSTSSPLSVPARRRSRKSRRP